ncbi:Ig-like domain-containing protein [Stigmatella sp. ncwal1]|uniref:Ig-like domain-containing protein n=1 Tax=Stigmatella ashevillensis TaxID=2995309 RepID=A0ABT5DFF3_9BACT|nr:Ig-like domain-containing protein [Stigmatella ashevillena]MDC0712391.1 Ig-like domain-containing protein [Stigmatella ashevillena]
MLMRVWTQALCAAVCVLVFVGCGGDECVDQYDCNNDKGPPPAGQVYACIANKCELRDANGPDAGTPDAGTPDAGTPDAGPPKVCTNSALSGIDQGCTAEKPSCDAAANGGLGQCHTCGDSDQGTGTDQGCSAAAPLCDQTANGGDGVCKACFNSATDDATDQGCSATAPLCDTAAGNGVGACKVCLDTAAAGSTTADQGCSAPTSLCDVSAANGAGACKICLTSDNEGCTGAQTCNAQGTACEGCEDNASCTNPSTPFCKPPPPVSSCVECLDSSICTAARPACNNTTNLCGCTTDAQCAAAPGTDDYCDFTASNGRGECKFCVTNAQCASLDPSKPFCDNKTACVQCVTNAGCALNQVCNASKACEDVPGADPAATSAQIQAFLNAAPGIVVPGLPITNAFITYLKPTVGTDAEGFFLQAEANGPAMFVVQGTTGLQVGDRVSIIVTQKTVISGIDAATSLQAAPTIEARDYPVQNLNTATPAGLAVDHSTKSDLVTNLDAYESELIHLNGTLAVAPASSGAGHVAIQITTQGMQTAASTFVLRLDATVASQAEIAPGCQFTLKAGPMWRFTPSATSNAAQPSAYYASDMSFTCPGPKLVSAAAASPTEVVLTFDRSIAPASVTNAAQQFTFDTGLTATAAEVEGKRITVTTNAQTGGTSYAVTVATSVTDTAGTPVPSPGNTATFKGFRTPAVLRINEVNPNVSTTNGNRDLIELKAISAGTTSGMTLSQEPANSSTQSLLATMPDVTVQPGDLIVIHMSPDAARGDATTNETTAKNENTATTNYPGAWDFVGNATHIVFSNQVLLIKTNTGMTQDAVPFVRSDLLGSSRPSGFPPRLVAIQSEGLWLPADCNGSPCVYDSTPQNAVNVSVDWKNAGTVQSVTTSVYRVGATDTNQASDWASGAQSFGLPNP